MFRTHNCGELNITHINKNVTLAGWVKRNRVLGSLVFIDLRDKFGVTQLTFNAETNSPLAEKAKSLGREFVIQATGKVIERSNKNKEISTGEIEILVSELNILNESKTPPFVIENNTDGGEELLLKYRYLDLRRDILKNNIILRNKLQKKVRDFLNSKDFMEIETPFLIQSTPEGARDFLVPSRINEGKFYALPQSPQIYKQLLMISGFDKYFQIVRCFRDEDLRSDRQPEFTQIDCETSFLTQEEILNIFEELVREIFKEFKNITPTKFKRLTYDEALNKYGSDKPDLRYNFYIRDLTNLIKNKDFKVFNSAEYVGGLIISSKEYDTQMFTRKFFDELTDYVKTPQVGASGMVYAKIGNDGIKSSVDKFYDENDKKSWFDNTDLNNVILILSGKKKETLFALDKLRREVANKMNILNNNEFSFLWVTDFPLFEWNEDEKRFYSMHHPFTSPKTEDIHLLDTQHVNIRASAYDMVINGVEVGGGSVRIYNKEIQRKVFKLLNFTDSEIQSKFGFLMNAFEYGTPPHGGIAFGFDRLCAILCGTDSIRDVIAFPKNNSGKDLMSGAPAEVTDIQLNELSISLNLKNGLK